MDSDIQAWRQATYEALQRQGRLSKALHALAGDLCEARTRRGGRCMAPGNGRGGRCKLHGGRSTGVRTPEGKVRQLEGIQRYWEARRAAQTQTAAPGGTAVTDE